MRGKAADDREGRRSIDERATPELSLRHTFRGATNSKRKCHGMRPIRPRWILPSRSVIEM